jgi:hypothetical protein
LDIDPARNYVALIGPAFQVVPEVVLTASRYLKPSGKDHFKWSDFYGAVQSRPGWLAQEFAEFMSFLGMAPFTLRGTEDIFDMRQKPLQFEESLKLAANQVFGTGNPGCTFKGTPTGRGREIRTPIPSLTLIYIWAEQQSKFVPDVDGPVLSISVYERNPEEDGRLQDAIITTESGYSVHRYQHTKPVKQGVGYCKVTYVAPLVRIIQETRESTVQCMADVLEVVRADHWLDA